MPLIFDTNILMYVARAKKGQDVVDYLNPNDEPIYISIVTEAEIRSLAIKNKWGHKRSIFLNDF